MSSLHQLSWISCESRWVVYTSASRFPSHKLSNFNLINQIILHLTWLFHGPRMTDLIEVESDTEIPIPTHFWGVRWAWPLTRFGCTYNEYTHTLDTFHCVSFIFIWVDKCGSTVFCGLCVCGPLYFHSIRLDYGLSGLFGQ